MESSRLTVPDESGSDESRLVPQLCGAAGTEDSLRVDLLALLSLIEGVSNVAFQLIQVLEMGKTPFYKIVVLTF
jgi:hypothetical protein